MVVINDHVFLVFRAVSAAAAGRPEATTSKAAAATQATRTGAGTTDEGNLFFL